jgi:hypothetical protein
VYFSEFTFTTSACQTQFQPLAADGLLYAVLHGEILASALDAEYVERTIGGTSWVSVSLDGFRLDPSLTSAHPSPIDLCTRGEGGIVDSNCIKEAKRVEDKPIRCIHSRKGETVGSAGYLQYPTFGSVMERVAVDRAVILFCLVLVLTYYQVGVKPQPNQYKNNVLYLVGLATYLYFTTDNNGMASPHSVAEVVRESYRAFTIVHPLTSPQIALSHFASYWVMVAAWRSKSLRNMLVWQLICEVYTAPLNEWTHHTEALHQVRCMRLAFISTVSHFVVDDVIRGYVLPPFFVYGHLLPQFLLFHLLGMVMPLPA